MTDKTNSDVDKFTEQRMAELLGCTKRALEGRRLRGVFPQGIWIKHNPATQKGLNAASQLRDQIVSLIKLGLLDQDKYAELFPGSATVVGGQPIFGEYARLWLDSREIVEGTRNGYKSALNLYWMPYLALVRIDLMSTTRLRQIITQIEWTTPAVKCNALVKLSTIMRSAVADGLIQKKPVEPIQLPKRTQHAHICRTVALGEVMERTKTGGDRFVLLNDRALHALEFARNYADRRKKGAGKILETPYVFPPSKNNEYVKQTSDLHHQWRPTLAALGIRYRPPYNCRHTYATICLMSGLNPAFISQQLGHSVQMLLSTYARWINSSSDWSELEKLQIGIKSVSAAIPAT